MSRLEEVADLSTTAGTCAGVKLLELSNLTKVSPESFLESVLLLSTQNMSCQADQVFLVDGPRYVFLFRLDL